MNKELFLKKYSEFNKTDEEIASYLQTVIDFEEYVNKDIIDTTIEDIQYYFKFLIKTKKNTFGNVIHFTRYYFYIDKKKEYIHMTKYFNTLGVLENILERVSLFESEELKNNLIRDVILPPFGTDVSELPKYTQEFIEKLNKYLPRTKCNKILAGNNHRIPPESLNKEKEIYNKSKSFKEYLEQRHYRKVQELQRHLDTNTVWFEQIITKDSIEFVRNNQEILSGVIEGNKLYVTKIPYDLENYLSESDEKLKRYYACHCSFVRENILHDNQDIPKEWCYCSAGFAKFPFEIILEQDLDVKLLNTPINGDYICRFEIDLEGVNYK